MNKSILKKEFVGKHTESDKKGPIDAGPFKISKPSTSSQDLRLATHKLPDCSNILTITSPTIAEALEASQRNSGEIVALGKIPEITYSPSSSERSEDTSSSPSLDRQTAAFLRAARALDTSKNGKPNKYLKPVTRSSAKQDFSNSAFLESFVDTCGKSLSMEGAIGDDEASSHPVPPAQVGTVPLVVLPSVQSDFVPAGEIGTPSSPIPSSSSHSMVGNSPKGKFSSPNRFEPLGDIILDEYDTSNESPMVSAISYTEVSSSNTHTSTSDLSSYAQILLLSSKLKEEKCSAETSALLSSLLTSLQPEVPVKSVVKESLNRKKSVKTVTIVEPPLELDSSDVANGESVPSTLPALQQYSICSADLTQPNSMVSVHTNQLLISRIPLSSSLPTILLDLQHVGSLLGVVIDVAEYEARALAGNGTFQKEGTRCSIVVHLTESHQFHTLGALRTPVLPIFVYTQKGSNGRMTSNRVTIQAIPPLSPLHVANMHEVVVYRGFPDSCHMASSLLPLLITETIRVVASDSLLFYYSSSPNIRYINNKRTYVDELYLRVLSLDPAIATAARSAFSFSDAPVEYALKCWRGLASPSFSSYGSYPTNTPALRTPITVTVLPGVTGNLEEDTRILSPYIAVDQLPLTLGYLRGDIDSPQFKDAEVALVLFPPLLGGTVSFNSAAWNNDFPQRTTRTYPLPGSYQLQLNFSIDPVVWKNPPNSDTTIGRGIFLERTRPAASPVTASTTSSSTSSSTSSTPNVKLSRSKRKLAKSSASQATPPLPSVTGNAVSVPPVGIPPLPRGTPTTMVTKQQGDLVAAQDDRFNAMMQLIKDGSDKAAKDREEDRAEARLDRANTSSKFDSLYNMVINIQKDKKKKSKKKKKRSSSDSDSSASSL